MHRIDAIVAGAARELATGVAVDAAQLTREHPDLMPELGERLHDHRLLGETELRAPQVGREARSRETRGVLLDEELQVLRDALGQYEVLEHMRCGGQGVVYKARQRGTNRIVALKLLLDGPLASERQRHRFEREIELVSRLRHPNIVAVYESGVVRGRNYYAMEFTEGWPIDDYMVLNDLAPRDIVRLIVKVCRAVHHAHQNGVIHRDLNPSNILVDEAADPHIYDFGLAKDLWESDQDVRCSFTGPGCGTLPYLSPEQAGGGDGKVDIRSDVYAIGVVLYELLTEMLPYPIEADPVAVRRAILATEPLPLRQAIAAGGRDRADGLGAIDRDLEVILTTALAKSKDDRYQTAAAFADDLERWLAGDAVAARAQNRLYVFGKTLRRHRIAVGFATIILAAIVVSSVSVGLSSLRVRAERDRAVAAACEAFGQFDVALTEIEDSVRPLAGGVAVRDRLIKRLAGKLPALQALAESDATLAPFRTQLLEKQGDIAAQQGQRDGAARFYQAFHDDCLRRAAFEPGNARCAADVLRGYRKLAGVCDAPTAMFEQGMEFGQRLASSNSEDDETRYELCRLILALELHLQNSGRYQDALERAERVLELCPSHGGGAPVQARWLPVIAEALNGKGSVLHKLGNATGGMEALQDSLKLREQISSESPADVEARLALLRSYSHIGTLCRDGGQLEQAKALWRRAAAQGELLAVLDPSSTARDRDRYAVHHKLASLCLDTGELGEARTQSERAVAIATECVGRDDGEDAQTTLLFALMLQGKVEESEKSWETACSSFGQALGLSEALLARDVDNPRRITQVAAVHDKLASCAQGLNDWHLALEHRRQVHDLLERLITLQAEGIDTALRVVAAHVKLASAYVDLQTAGDYAAAASLLSEAEDRLLQLESAGKLAGWEDKQQFLVRTIRQIRERIQQQYPDSAMDGVETLAPLTHRDTRPDIEH